MTMVELIVDMDCAGCESKIKKALEKLKGVDDVEVDMNMQKVTVTGWAEQEKILKTVRKTGKRADLWPYTPECQHNVAIQHYYQQYHYRESDHHEYHPIAAYDIPNLPSIISQNYFLNGHDRFDNGYFGQQPAPFSTLVDHKATSMFSDENPHACSIM